MTLKLKWRHLAMITVVCMALDVATASKDVIKSFTTGFTKVLEDCKKELNLPEHVMQDFYNFWKEDYALVNRDMGCALMCMAAKFDMVTDDMKLHKDNAHDFAKKHGADDGLAKQLVGMLHECEKVTTIRNDDCMMVLEIAKCFKTKIHELNWAPTMEIILEEVMTEM